VKRFRGGLVFKAHRLFYHSTLGLRVIKKKRRRLGVRGLVLTCTEVKFAATECPSSPITCIKVQGWGVRVPLSSEYGTCKTVKAWLSGKSPLNRFKLFQLGSEAETDGRTPD